MSPDTGFLTLSNPELPFPRPKRRSKSYETALPFEFRDMPLTPPPLAIDERIPFSFALNDGEVALSIKERPTHFYFPTLNLYVLNRHRPMLELALSEIANLKVDEPHGVALTYRHGCKGPLCRKAIREQQAETTEFRLQRERRRAKVSRPTRFQRMLVGRPQYAAVDPLLTALTIDHLKNNPPKYPHTRARELMQVEDLLEFLRIEFPNIDV
jgi:hypothetical protein